MFCNVYLTIYSLVGMYVVFGFTPSLCDGSELLSCVKIALVSKAPPPPLEKGIPLGNFLEYFVLRIEFIGLAFTFLSTVARPAPADCSGICWRSWGGLQILAKCEFIQAAR